MMLVHGLARQEAFEAAINVHRETTQPTTQYYEDISSDETTFDMFEKLDNLNDPFEPREIHDTM